MKLNKKILLLATLTAFGACNSNSVNKDLSGPLAITDDQITSFNVTISTQFIDVPVKGLNLMGEDGVKTISGSGGSFSCLTGQLVTFMVGNLTLGKAVCSDKIFITEIAQGNFNRAVGVGVILQTLNGNADEDAEMDVTSFKEQDFSALQSAYDTFMASEGGTDDLMTLLEAFKSAGIPGFDEVASDPKGAYDKSRAHLSTSLATYYTVPAWAATPVGDVTFEGALTLDTENSTATDCSQTANLSGNIAFNEDVGFFQYRYQIIQNSVSSDGSLKRILQSSDRAITQVTDSDQQADFKQTKVENAWNLTGNNVSVGYSALFETLNINAMNSLLFDGTNLEELTLKGSVGNMIFDPTQKKVLGCIYKVSIPGKFNPPGTPTPTPTATPTETPTPTPTETPTPSPSPTVTVIPNH